MPKNIMLKLVGSFLSIIPLQETNQQWHPWAVLYGVCQRQIDTSCGTEGCGGRLNSELLLQWPVSAISGPEMSLTLKFCPYI